MALLCARTPYKAAEITLEKIRRETDLFHALLTIDVLSVTMGPMVE